MAYGNRAERRKDLTVIEVALRVFMQCSLNSRKGGLMKKIVAMMAVIALGVPGLAMAKGGTHPMAGCGLGYVLFGHNDNTPIMQVLAATTNGTSGNQTFGMTTG